MNAGSVTPRHRILAELRRIPTYHQRRAVPTGDEVAVDRPLQHLLPLGDREFPERPSPLRQRVATPDVVHQDGHLVAERLLRLAALWVEAGIRGLPGQRWGSRGSITSMIYPPGFCVCTPSGLSRHIDIPA